MSRAPAAAAQPSAISTSWGDWALLLGFAALALPTAISLWQDEWTRDYGAHEPLVLLVTCWLFWRERQVLTGGRPGRSLLTAAQLALALPIYVLGRAYDFPTFEALGLYGVGLALLYARLGPRILGHLWFPLLFLLFAVPLPLPLLDALTGPMKQLVSATVASGLRFLGMPVAREGVIIFVAQYELLVEDACSGLNSLMGLTALSLLYGYLSRGASPMSAFFMLFLAIPVAIAANVVRVSLLVLVTYLFGDAAAQGFLHFMAGLLLFLSALALIFLVDRAAQALRSLGNRLY